MRSSARKSTPGKVRYCIGAVLVVLGVLLLLSNTSVINLDGFWNFVRTWWPLLLIIWGAWELVSGGFRLRLWPVILLLLGIGFQLSALNLWEWDFSVVWPAFIVIVGLALLLGRRRRPARRRHRPAAVSVESAPVSFRDGSEPDLSWRAVFNSIEERYAGPDFRSGEVVANFGNVALDLREATLSGGAGRLDVNLAFGGLQLSVPPGWQVDCNEVRHHFGHVEFNRPQPDAESVTGELRIAGTVSFGSLVISN